MSTKATCDVPDELKEAAIVKATGNTFDRKEDIRRAGATFMTHGGKLWAWKADQCDLVNTMVEGIPGVGAKTCVMAALVTPDELTTVLGKWYKHPLIEWTARGRPSMSSHVKETRTRIGLIERNLGIRLYINAFDTNEEKIRRALKSREKRKSIMDDPSIKVSPRMLCIEPSKELVDTVEKGIARVVTSKKYDLGYVGRYDKDVKQINTGIVELFYD